MGIGSFFREASERILGKAAKEVAEDAALQAGREAAERVAHESAERAAREAAERAARMTPEEITERLARAQAKGVAERAAQTAGKAAGETAEQAAPGAAKAGFTAAADDVAEEAVEAGAKATNTLSRRQTYRLLESKESIADKLTILSRNGRDDLFDRVLLQARKNGLSAGDNSVIQLRKDLPEALRTRVQEIFTLQSTGSRFARAADSLRATFSMENAKGILSGAASHPFKSAYDLFAQQWRVPIGTLKWAGQHKAAAGLMGIGGVGAVSGLDMATDGVSTDIAGTATRGVVSAYIAADKALLSVGGTVLGAGLNLVTTDGAEKAVDAAGDATHALASNSPSMFGRFMDRATDGKTEEFLESASNIPLVGTILPGPVKTLLRLDRAANAIENNGGAAATGEAVANRAAGAAATVAGAAGTATDTAQGALDSVSIANALRNPEQAWEKLKEFSATNPTMRRAVEFAEQNPFLKMGLIGGFAMGALGRGTPLERIGNGLKSALIFGVMLDLLGGLFGKPSFIMNSLGNMMSPRSNAPQRSLSAGMENALGITPATPAAAPATTTATPATTRTPADPGADPLTTIPASTASGPAPIKGNFQTQAQPPVQPDLSANQQAFKGAVQPATPPAPGPNFSDLHQRQNLVYAPSTM